MNNKYLVVFALLLFSCTSKKEEQKENVTTLFSAVPSSKSGLDFSNDLHYTPDLNIIDYLYYYNGGGVAVGDINNDGLEDVYLTANQKPDKLFLNQGNLTFKDISISAGIAQDSTWSTGVTMEDLNNDGLLDIYVSKVGVFKGLETHNMVYMNQGNATFKESSAALGLHFSGYSTQTAFLDYDRDGDLDIYLVNHSVHTPRSYGKTDKRTEVDGLSGDRFYENKLNEGVFTFEDVSQSVGIYSSALGYGLGVSVADINSDGFPDIYVCNDFHENDYLYINQGDKTFKESSSSYLKHTSRFSMGVDIADLNNDNLPDIFTLDMMPYKADIFLKSGGEDSDKVTQIKNSFGFNPQYARNNFQLNTGNNSFTDIALITSTYATDWSWSVLLQDYDNDGLEDIFITNGIYKRPNDLDYIKYLSTIDFSEYKKSEEAAIEKKLIDKMPALKIPNVLFRNKGNMSFDKLSEEVGLSDSYSNGAAYSDLDNDGDLDLIINNINESVTLLENTSNIHNQKYIQFSFASNEYNVNPNGTAVILYTPKQVFSKKLAPTRGFQSSSSRKIHIGLGNIQRIDSAVVIWPDGHYQIEKQLKANTVNTLSKQANTKPFTFTDNKEKPYTLFPFTHKENSYQDYTLEPLIPEKLSSEGPASVYADFNGDGLNDLFLGGGKNQSSQLFLQNASGEYIPTAVPDFEKDSTYEDIDAVAFDLENDGDLDVYVVSGGNDAPQGSESLEDRIYLNDGKGNLERLQAKLPANNGSTVSAGDYNNDGFKDLFIGTRSIPGNYGLAPKSFILKNTGKGNFEMVAQDPIGMITDSEWADINNDGYLDLILVGDWMPITILLNNTKGQFSNATEKLGLSNTTGMWNTIAIADIDQNGYVDIVGGNAGKNFKWKASSEHPVQLFIDDFDTNGQTDPLIFYHFFDKDVPFASKDLLISQLPYLKKSFLNYSDFSTIENVESLTGKAIKDIKVKRNIQELRSMLFLNSGSTLKAIPLPDDAQTSTIEDIAVVNGALYYVGNFYEYVTELGPNDGNSGGILSSFKTDTFTKKERLPIPTNLNCRKIIALDNGSFLVVTNNDDAYLIK